MKLQPHESRMNLRRRPKRAGRQLHDDLNVCGVLDQDAEDAVLLAAGRRDQPVGDFALEHHGCIGKWNGGLPGPIDQFEQDGRRHVIWQVPRGAHDTRHLVRFQSEILIRLQEVARDDRQSRRCRRLKSCGEVAIDLERDHRPRALDERARQRAAAGSDFDEELIGFRIDGADHFVDPDPLEKVLAEPLLMLAGPPSLR